jgi:hypothetical protein
MDFDNFDQYIQERWEGMIEILEEKTLKDYALGRAMINFSKSDNPLNKALQKRGQKQADKYTKKQHDHNLAKMELIAEQIAGMLLTEVEKHDSKISGGEVTTNEQETSTVVKAVVKPVFDFDSFSDRLSNYLIRCCDRGDIDSYDFGFTDNGRFRCVLKISKK